MSTSFTVVCPHCKNKMRATADFIGKKGRCPVCDNLVEITAPAGAGQATTIALVPSGDAEQIRSAAATTEVSGWQSGLIGLAIASLIYGVIYFLPDGWYLKTLAANGGTVSVCNTVVTCWGLAILVMKFLVVKRQQGYADRELEFIPLDIALQITPSRADQFLARLSQIAEPERNSILARRIRGALEHFRSRKSVPEVQEYLATQAQLDSSGVDAGYTLLRAFIWVNPILGFIGTVVGIGVAVGGLAESLQGGGDVMAGLGLITGGLSTAFDTTLIGLVMATVLLFPTEMLRKVEYAMLDRIEAFCFDNLLRRLDDGKSDAEVGELPEIVRGTLEAAFREHQRWLVQWQAQVGELGEVIGARFEQSVDRIQERISANERSRTEKLDQLSGIISDLFRTAGDVSATWQRLERDREEQCAALSRAGEQLESVLQRSEQLLSRQIDGQERGASQDLDGTLRDVQAALARLAHALEQPAEQPMLAPNHDGANRVATADPRASARTGLLSRILGR